MLMANVLCLVISIRLVPCVSESKLFNYGTLYSRHLSRDALAWILATTLNGDNLTHAHSHIPRAVAAMDSCFALIGVHQHGIAVGSKKGRTYFFVCLFVSRRVYVAESNATPLI